jgi:hypothetical protein
VLSVVKFVGFVTAPNTRVILVPELILILVLSILIVPVVGSFEHCERV